MSSEPKAAFAGESWVQCPCSAVELGKSRWQREAWRAGNGEARWWTPAFESGFCHLLDITFKNIGLNPQKVTFFPTAKQRYYCPPYMVVVRIEWRRLKSLNTFSRRTLWPQLMELSSVIIWSWPWITWISLLDLFLSCRMNHLPDFFPNNKIAYLKYAKLQCFLILP